MRATAILVNVKPTNMNKPTKTTVFTQDKAKDRPVTLSSGTKHTTNPTTGSGNKNAPMGNHSLDGAHGNRAKHV